MKFTLRLKLILLFTSLVMTIQLTTGYFITRHMEQTMNTLFHRQTMPTAIILAQISASPMISKDLLALRNIIRVAMEQDGISQAMILDKSGTVIMHSSLTEVGKIRNEQRFKISLQQDAPGVSEDYLNENGDLTNDIYAPIKVSGTHLGAFFVTCPQQHIAKQIHKLKIHIMAFLACGILPGIIFAILLASHLTNPLRRLTRVAGQITDGAFPQEELCITGYDEIATLTESFNAMAKKLKKMVYHDPLTGAYNRQMFQQRIAQEIAHSHRHDQPLSLLMIDIDHFKLINDTLGHLIGDKVLKELSDLLCKTVRTDDYLARFGGEEFVVIAPDTTIETAFVLAERIRATVAAHKFDIGGADTRRLTISIGVATLNNKEMTADDLIRNADDALYAAKESGRNRVCRADNG